MADLHLAGADLGMSPAARARLVAPPDDLNDPMALLLSWQDDPAAPWANAKRN